MRRRRAERRSVRPDPKYNSELLARFINKMMVHSKKSLSERIVYQAFDIVEKDAGRPPLEAFEQAVKNTTPLLQVKPRRVGGATYQVPIEVSPAKGTSLAMRWLVRGARTRTGRAMREKLAAELLEASKGAGTAVKRREDLHRMAEANRAFVHYRW